MTSIRLLREGSALALCVFALVLLAACGSGAQPVTGSEREQVLAYAEPKTDNLMAGFNANVYAAFARDFDPAMSAAMSQSTAEQSRANITGKIGKYVARKVEHVEKVGQFIAVVYTAEFEQEDAVTLRVVFEAGGDHRISGLWFNSPKLH